MNPAAMPPETAAILAQYRTHALPVDGVLPCCGVGAWDTVAAPLGESRTAVWANVTCDGGAAR